MYSKHVLIGNLGSEPDSRYTPGGDMVVSFSLAVNKSWTGKDGQKVEKVTWYRVTSWRKLAETVAQYCKKGDRVLVEGEDLEARAYANKNTGEPAAALELTANTVRFLTPKGMTEPPGPQASAPMPQRSSDALDDDIPF